MMNVLKFSLLSLTLCSQCFSFAQANTLADIYELALSNDPTLRAAEASYLANAEVRKQSRSALLPQISGSASYEEGDSESIGFRSTVEPPSKTDSDSNSEVYSLSIRQTLFDLSKWFSFKQGQSLSKTAQATFSAEQQNLIVRVSEAYFSVLRAMDDLAFARAEERSIGQQLEQTKQRYDVGLIAVTDVHEAQAAYDLSIANRLNQENILGIAFEGLSVITGQKHSNLWPLKENFVISSPDPADINKWADFALENNHTLEANRHSVKAALENNRAKKSAHLPTVTGEYAYRKSDTNAKNIVTESMISTPFNADSDFLSDSISVTLNVPIFTGGLTSSQRRQSAYEYNNAYETMIANRRSILQNTRSLYLTTLTSVATIKARKNAIVSSQSALEATKSGYNIGTRNIVDLLNAQTDLYRAQSSYTNSRYDYVINLLKLKETAGILSPQDIYDLNKWLEEPADVSLSDIAQ